MESVLIILDFRLRAPARRGHRGLRPGGILDLWNRYTLSIFTHHASGVWVQRRRRPKKQPAKSK
jgi:hypothetical protein